jgi:MFS family permease
MLPWDFKIIYGIITDTIILPKFEQSPKRGYIIIWGAIQTVALLLLAFFELDSYKIFCVLIFTVSLSGAFMDVVIDGLTTIQQRRDPISGSEDLQTFQFIGSSIGMMLAATVGSTLTQYSDPKNSFFVWAFVGLLVTYFARKMSTNLEKISDSDSQNQIETNTRETFWQRCKKDFNIVKDNLKEKCVWKYYLFFVINGLKPKFEGMQYILMKEVYQITQV